MFDISHYLIKNMILEIKSKIKQLYLKNGILYIYRLMVVCIALLWNKKATDSGANFK